MTKKTDEHFAVHVISIYMHHFINLMSCISVVMLSKTDGITEIEQRNAKEYLNVHGHYKNGLYNEKKSNWLCYTCLHYETT